MRYAFPISFVLCIIMLALLASCKTEKWATKKLAVIENKQPAVLANWCGNRFPPIVFDSTRTEYLPGATVYDVDSVYVDCDSAKASNDLNNRTGATRIVKSPCPPSIYRVDTMLIRRSTQVENKGKMEALTIERDKDKAALVKAEQGRSMWRWIAILLIAYTVIRWVLKAWLKISLP